MFSSAMAHSAHSNHSQNTTTSSQSGATSMISGYPESTVLIVVGELGLGLLLIGLAVWHFRRN